MHMTTEEKLKHFSEVSMETAREEAQRAITEYKAVLEKTEAFLRSFHGDSQRRGSKSHYRI